MDGRPADSEADEPSAVPGVQTRADATNVRARFRLEVDGELFDVEHRGGNTDYTWLSGPNHGYGFGTSGPAHRSVELHREAIRGFLAMVDPATGYIEDD